MKNNNELLYKAKDYISKLKNDFTKINKDNIPSFIKERKLLVSVVVILTLAILTSFFDMFITTKNELLKDLEIAIKRGNSNKIYGDIVIDNNKVSGKELDPLIEYYNLDTKKRDILLSELKANGESGVFTIKNIKKGIYQDYYLEVEAVNLKVNCNFKDAKIFINNKISDEGNEKVELVPGLYRVKAQLKTNYGDVEKEVEVSLMQNEEVDIKLEAVNLNITSNFNDAKIFINDKDINKTVNEISTYGAIPTDKNIDIQLQRNFPWGIIKSEKVKVIDSPNINIDIDMVNKELTTQIESSINRFYESVFNALNDGKHNKIILTNEEVQKKIYDEINKKSFIFKNNYEITGLEIKIENSEFKYENNTYKAQIVVKLKYEIQKKIFSSSFKEGENMFLTNIELVEGTWIVKDIQKFNLE